MIDKNLIKTMCKNSLTFHGIVINKNYFSEKLGRCSLDDGVNGMDDTEDLFVVME